jgi:homoserine kinase
VLIPGFDLIKQTALENGALGSGISGSGPSIFALSKGRDAADKIAKAMSAVYDEMKLPYEIHVSKVNPDGVRIL